MGQPRIQALIPAAGRSVRFGGTTLKQYAHLLGRPVISHSIHALLSHPLVRGVTVALAPDDGIFRELVQPDFPSVHLATGGEHRAQTVLNGLQQVLREDPQCDWVLVHDAARPCLARESLDKLIKGALVSEDGAILAVPVNDTLKQADGATRIAHTVDRSRYWAAQTPQLFESERLVQCLEHMLASGEVPTDEAAAMEFSGFRPGLVEGLSSNIKITGTTDLALAEFILQRQSLERR